MNFKSIENLEESLLKQFLEVYNSSNNISIHQNPGFPLNQLKRWFYLEVDNCVKSYCVVAESNLSKLPFVKTAKINFGPVSVDDDYSNHLLDFIISYYKKNKFSELIIDPLINKLDYFSQEDYEIMSNTGTLLIDLTKEIEEIESDFSTILKKNLKRGRKLDISIEKLLDNQVVDFADLYMKMSQNRGVNHYSKDEIISILQFTISKNQGLVLGCFYESKLIGGVVCIFQGKRVEYFLGVSDFEYRKLPQSHLTLFQAIKRSKELGFKLFDMGGISFTNDENNQLYHISNFKRHFSKNEINFCLPIILKTNKLYSFMKRIYLKIAS